MLKPALCAAALVVAAAVAIPAIAQQSPQGDPPSATHRGRPGRPWPRRGGTAGAAIGRGPAALAPLGGTPPRRR